MFENVFSGGVDTFGDLADAIKRVFIRLAAEIAALLVFRPVIGGILTSAGAGAITGLTGTGAGAGGGGGFGGFGSPSLFDVGSVFNQFGLLDPVLSSVNTFGASIGFGGLAAVPGGLGLGSGAGGAAFGAGVAAVPGGLSNAAVSGVGSITSASLSSVLGAVGLGALAGGLIGNFFGGQGGLGGTLGGGAGAGIGLAVGGPVGGIIGGLLGSVGGGFIGSLFGGGSPSDDVAFSRAGITAAGGVPFRSSLARPVMRCVRASLNSERYDRQP